MARHVPPFLKTKLVDILLAIFPAFSRFYLVALPYVVPVHVDLASTEIRASVHALPLYTFMR